MGLIRFWFRIAGPRAWSELGASMGGVPRWPVLIMLTGLPLGVKAYMLAPLTVEKLPSLFDPVSLSGGIFSALVFIYKLLQAPGLIYAEQRAARDALEQRLRPGLAIVYHSDREPYVAPVVPQPGVQQQRIIRLGVRNLSGTQTVNGVVL